MAQRTADMPHMPHMPGLERDEAFHAQQNARLVRDAEEYYRPMFRARVSFWNLRDSHMVETLQARAARRRALPCGRITRTWGMPRPLK